MYLSAKIDPVNNRAWT